MNRRHLLQAILAITGISVAGHATGASAAPLPSKVVEVTGAVATPLSLTVADLKKFLSQVVDFKAADNSVRQYTGVLLRDVLAAAKPLEGEHSTLRQSYALAKSTDGYFALFTWAELFISPIGDGALLVYLRDGALLGDDEGGIALISARDTRSGPRYVKWLTSIDFRRAIP